MTRLVEPLQHFPPLSREPFQSECAFLVRRGGRELSVVDGLNELCMYTLRLRPR